MVRLNGRYPLMQDLCFNTKLRCDQRQRKDGSVDEVPARGSLALTCNLGRMTHFNLEIGGQCSDTGNPLADTKERRLFGSFGILQDVQAQLFERSRTSFQKDPVYAAPMHGVACISHSLDSFGCEASLNSSMSSDREGSVRRTPPWKSMMRDTIARPRPAPV